jgi:hypothetical protein
MRRFGRFWYDFVIGDDWRIAAGVVVGLALTAWFSHQGWSAWWLLPVLVSTVLAGSIAVEVRGRDRHRQIDAAERP